MNLRKNISLVTLLLFSYSQVVSAAQQCQKASEICIDGPSTKTISGQQIYEPCWQYQDVYVCSDASNPVDQCAPLRDQGCTQYSGPTCAGTDTSGKCTLQNYVYQCASGTATTTTNTCLVSDICTSSGACFNTNYSADQNFALAATTKEIGREIGQYGSDASFGIFTGTSEQCHEGWAGIKSCCGTSGGAKSNSSAMGGGGAATFVTQMALSKSASALGQAFSYYASPYVYDMMYSAGSAMGGQFGSFLMEKGLSNAEGYAQQYGSTLVNSGGAISQIGGSFSAWSLTNVSYMGFTMGWGGAELGAGDFVLYGEPTQVINAAGETTTTLASGQFSAVFNPYMLAFQVAVMVIMKLHQCEQSEQMLSMHRGAGLCHYVGEYCTESTMFGCVESAQSYCCFNSLLGRVIQEQGRPLIGKTWGDPSSPDCSGFTQAQLSQLDFSKMDFREFSASIASNVQTPSSTDINSIANYTQNNAQTAVSSGTNQNALNGYLGSTAHQSVSGSSINSNTVTNTSITWTYTPTPSLSPLTSVDGSTFPTETGATVAVYAADALGRQAAQIGAGFTDAHGKFSVGLSTSVSTPLIVIVSGGTSVIGGIAPGAPTYSAIVPSNSTIAAALVVSQESQTVLNLVQQKLQDPTMTFDSAFSAALLQAAQQYGINGNVLLTP
ncbi:conjugal transfer protein TraN [Paludibacterium yongneupense]|uniref:conjugal transfer protein TraN n=1 Tax=Paludibacterium yongneupense TaxID=400061 RepID=UPI0004906286|nr:conjugal transfer protein TraN [Paludibacterium yongneupense]